MEADWFAPRLKQLREQAGLTQPQLAERSGMNRFGIAKLEQGVTKPSWDTVIALCKALTVSCDVFLQPPAATPEPKRGRPPKAGPSSQPAAQAKRRRKKGE